MLLDGVTVFAEECAGLDHLDSFVQTFSRCFRYAYRVWVCQRLVTNVVCLIQVAVKTVMEQGYVDVEDVAILENPLIRDTVTDDFINGCTY